LPLHVNDLHVRHFGKDIREDVLIADLVSLDVNASESGDLEQAHHIFDSIDTNFVVLQVERV